MYVLWSWLRWLIGYAEVEIRGAYGERFLTLCMKEEIDLWAIRRVCPGIIRVCLFSFSLGKLEPLARKSGVTLDHCRRVGFPTVLKRYRLRPGLFLGGLLYLGLMLLLPCFVWSVEIPEANPVQAAQIRSILADEGVGVGTFAPSVDFRRLKYRLMLEDDDVSFVSVNMQGSRAVVAVHFAKPAPEISDKTPCNIVASRDGQIVSILVRNGIRCVQKGQTVQKGDLLVGGLVDTRLGYYAVHSDAQIFARVTDMVSETVSLTQTVAERTGRVSVRRIWNLFGKEIDVTPHFSCPYTQYDTVTEKKHLSFGEESVVPITLTEVYYYETVSHQKQISPEEAEFFARRRLDETDRLRLCGVRVESVKESVSASAQEVTVTRVRSLIVDICEKKEFYFENEGS